MDRILKYYTDLYQNNLVWIRKILSWFGFAFCIGMIAYFARPDLILTIARTFADRFGEAPAMNFDLALQIFLQNLIASSVALLGGIFLGLTPLLVVFVNGFLIGYVVVSILFIDQTNVLHSIAVLIGGLIPHGIFELPAFLLAATLGLRLGWEWMQKASAGNRLRIFGKNLLAGLAQLPLLAVILFIAAIIEVFVSGWIVNNL